MTKPIQILFTNAVLALIPGCIGGVIEPKFQNPSASEPTQIDWSGWGLTLSRSVVKGRVDYAKIIKNHEPLDRFLWVVARVGPGTTPQQFPDRESKLAYAINCYNATILRSTLELADRNGLPYRVPWNLATRFRFRIDGTLQTPADIRKRIDTLADDDFRIQLVLCDARRDSPPLPPRAFLPEMLDAQLSLAAREALCEPQVVTIDHGVEKRLLLGRTLFAMREKLVEDYEQRYRTSPATILNVLCEWSGHERRITLNSAIGYDVAPVPADDRLNGLELPTPRKLGDLTFF